jgi:hypothetical protein
VKKLKFIFIVYSIIFYQGCAPYSETSKLPRPRVTLDPNFSPEVYKRIAIYVEDRTKSLKKEYRRYSFLRYREKDSSNKEGILRQIEDEFMRSVINKGYSLATRSDIEKISKELDFQESGFSEGMIAKKAKALNVSAVLLVSINELTTTSYIPFAAYLIKTNRKFYKTTINISARLINAERAQVMWISSYSKSFSINDRSDINKYLIVVANIVASGLPDRK